MSTTRKALADVIANYVPLGFEERDPYRNVPEAARAIADAVLRSDWLVDELAAERERIAKAIEVEYSARDDKGRWVIPNIVERDGMERAARIARGVDA
jgi:hypothetical protein